MSTVPGSSAREAVARATARRERREARSRWWRFALLAVGVLVVDQIIKAIVRARLESGDSVRIFPGFSISRVSNEGIAFGLFPGNQAAVAVLTVLALSGIAIAVAALARRHPFVAAGGGLLMGGSVSNLIDRLAHGGVTDYLDPAHWWAFNVADVAIVVGAGLIIWGLLGEDDAEDADA